MRRVHVLSSEAQGFSAKLAPKYEGPYKMLERKSPTVYECELKKYVAPRIGKVTERRE